MSEASKSELYAKHQQLFDDCFTEIMVNAFVVVERSKFDKLSDNDPVTEENGHA